MTDTDVTIVEVGPRDGLQSVQQTMSTAAKCRWIDALAAAGLEHIQVGSFVSPRALPQMADCADVVEHALTIPGCGSRSSCRTFATPRSPWTPAFRG